MAQNVSVIIPTLNEQTFLPKLLASLAAQRYEAKLQIIVVDGGSSDKTLEVAKAFKGKIDDLEIITSARGLSHQRNVGASKSKYSHLVFLDADVVLAPKFLQKLYGSKNALSTKPYIGIPLILPDRLNLLDYCFTMGAYIFFLLNRFTHPIVTGMCLVTTQENHKQVGGFNERAAYAEDIQYGLDSAKKGARYHVFLNAHVFASARRGRELGRVKLARIWLGWYHSIIKHGAVTDKSLYDYKYGRFQ